MMDFDPRKPARLYEEDRRAFFAWDPALAQSFWNNHFRRYVGAIVEWNGHTFTGVGAVTETFP